MTGEESLRRRAPGQRREAVLAAAQNLFVEQGIGGTSIDGIAQRAGVAKGTAYLYFSSKDEIVREIEARFNGRILDRVRSRTAAVAAVAPEDAVVAWCLEFVHAYLDDLAVHDMLFYGHTATTREAVAENALIDDLTDLLATRHLERPEVTAGFLVGGITLVVDRAVLASRTVDRAAVTEQIRHLLAGVAGTRQTI